MVSEEGKPEGRGPPTQPPGPWQRARAHEEPRQLGNVLDQEGKPEGRGPPHTPPGAMAEGQGTRGTQAAGECP